MLRLQFDSSSLKVWRRSHILCYVTHDTHHHRQLFCGNTSETLKSTRQSFCSHSLYIYFSSSSIYIYKDINVISSNWTICRWGRVRSGWGPYAISTRRTTCTPPTISIYRSSKSNNAKPVAKKTWSRLSRQVSFSIVYPYNLYCMIIIHKDKRGTLVSRHVY